MVLTHKSWNNFAKATIVFIGTFFANLEKQSITT
jgi:hypothetical protein